jgi:hypothetical protein
VWSRFDLVRLEEAALDLARQESEALEVGQEVESKHKRRKEREQDRWRYFV